MTNGIIIGLLIGLGIYTFEKWINKKIQEKSLRKWIIQVLYEGSINLEEDYNEYIIMIDMSNYKVRRDEIKNYSYEKLKEIKTLICQYKTIKSIENLLQGLNNNW